MRRAMIPCAVVNACRAGKSVLHLVNESSCFEADPTLWTTKCGWAWIRSCTHAKPLFDPVEDEAADFIGCAKCHGLDP